MITQELLQKCRLYIPNKSSALKTLRYKSMFAHKSIGRIPTVLYNHLTKFNQKSITIQPRMEYLPICQKLAHQNFENISTMSPQIWKRMWNISVW